MTSPKQLAERALEAMYRLDAPEKLVEFVPALATEVLKLLEENAVMRMALDDISYESDFDGAEWLPTPNAKHCQEALRKADGIRNGDKI